jgi:hypothetical protein
VNVKSENNLLKLQFNKTYFLGFIILLIIEIAIATFLSEGFFRSTFGDYLVVILIYCFIKAVVDFKPKNVAIGVLVFAYTIEFLQLFNLLEFLNLKGNKMANIVLGSTFHLNDLISYTLGTFTIMIVEYKLLPRIFKSS